MRRGTGLGGLLFSYILRQYASMACNAGFSSSCLKRLSGGAGRVTLAKSLVSIEFLCTLDTTVSGGYLQTAGDALRKASLPWRAATKAAKARPGNPFHARDAEAIINMIWRL